MERKYSVANICYCYVNTLIGNMDVLKPEILCLGKCRYRVPQLVENVSYQVNDVVNEEPSMQDFSDYGDGPCANDTESSEIQQLGNGRFQLCLGIPSGFWGSIIGAKGVTRRRIEDETGTTINVPKPNQVGDITILGSTPEHVISARTRVETVVRDARQKIKYTHFLSIPAGSELQTNFSTFKERAQKLCPSITDDYFTRPEKLHLTLNCLLLMNDSEFQQACRIFHDLKPFILEKLGGKKLSVAVEGIDIMNDDPAKARVLYGKVNDPLLQDIANEILSRFIGTEFVKDHDIKKTVKLHLTLINVKHAEKAHTTGNERHQRGRQFYQLILPANVQPILNELKNFYFGVIPIDSIHLSQMGSVGVDGYYLSCASIRL